MSDLDDLFAELEGENLILVEEVPEVTEDDLISERLSEYCKIDETIICVPQEVDGTQGFVAKNLKLASDEEVEKWVKFVCPFIRLKKSIKQTHNEELFVHAVAQSGALKIPIDSPEKG